MSLPPGPRMPTAVMTLGWMARPMPFMERCRERFGDVFTLRIGNEGAMVFLAHPDAVKEVFTADPRLLHAGEANAILGPVLGPSSVLLLDDAPHLRQRRLLLPPFHGERMQHYQQLMREIARRELASWPADEALAALPRMQAVTLEIILRAVFGAAGAELDRLRTEMRRMLDQITDWRAFVMVAALGPERMKRNPLHRRTMAPIDAAVLAQIRARRGAPDLAERDDILSLLLQATHSDGSPMRDEELRDELLTLLVAGHETTATTISWALERVLRHPAVLDRLRADPDDDAYADAVVAETLRLRPVIPIVARRLKAPMRVAGWDLPEGVTVAPCVHLVHRRADVYPEPRAFRPERFEHEPPGTYTWIPFGGGVRRCLGASFALTESRVVLQETVRALDLRASRPAAERVRRRAITLTPERGGEVLVSR